MNSRERVHAALQRRQPDRVPYCELAVDRALATKFMGWDEPVIPPGMMEVNHYTVEESKSLADFLKLDNIGFVLRPPVYAERIAGQDGRMFYGEGMIRSEADLSMLQAPDPFDDSLYDEARRFVDRKGDFSAWFMTRIGVFSAMLSMGTEGFCLMLHDNLPLVESVLDYYFDWMEVVAERVCKMGFDVFVSTDDMAFKTAPLFSPKVFREVVLPRYQRVARKISIPWVLHSDGNLMPILDDLLSLGISGLHPIEKGAMDMRAMKRDYGDRICLLGNVDLNLLGIGTREEVEREVRTLIRDAAPGGGYILTSGNSLASYLRPENVLAMVAAVKKYGRYPLDF
jgi:uroporphyrinogen decarboxylase